MKSHVAKSTNPWGGQAGQDCTSRKTHAHWHASGRHNQAHDGPGISLQDLHARTQRGRLSVRAASLASQQPIGRGFASPEPIDASGWPHAILRIATKIRATRNAGSARRAAGPDIPQGARGWDSEARLEAAGGSRAARADGTDEWV